ncbi:MAG TPA: helix-turn-helix transcriptional regulator [Bryobacteraceae bacterium]|jgi:cytoskeletal protein RodZ|nr:helix-turn-helix transcriptional regulator [Bryobacteraceae bacterium]
MREGILGVRVWRQQRGISLEAIAASTKLSVRHLEAIEAGEFGRLPGGIYNTSYIRQYARAIDFDEADLLAYYQDTCNPATPIAGNGTPANVTRPLFQH